MSKKLFGTDGVRGVANEKLSPELCFQIGQAAGHLLSMSEHPSRIVMGRDTRLSGSMLGAALAAGFCSAGVEVLALGVVPTGLVSYVARTGHYGLGVVISASHNPAPDNGVKLIGHDGRKVSDDFERQVESLLGEALPSRPTGGAIGRIDQDRAEVERYLDYLESLCPERLEGLKVVIDAAHGAAHELGPEICHRLGATVSVHGASPDGMNINADGGATKPETVQKLTESLGYDLGIAFDGDADRAVFSDPQGRLINGDRTMAMWCEHYREELDPPAVVGTVMSNGGFEHHMQQIGIRLDRANVGDKYVSARLSEIGGRIGGEQSGHIIFPELGPTGDGLITAIEVARVLKRSGRSAAEFYDLFENWPQVLVNVEIGDKDSFQSDSEVQSAISSAQEALGTRGRINVRPSGTQPMVRVMVEADDWDLRDQTVDRVVQTMLSRLGGSIYSRVDLTHALGD